MTADGSRQFATYADLEAVPPHLVAEIIHGQLVTHPRPAPRHVRAATRLGSILGPPFDLGEGGPGGWTILIEPELHLGPEVVVPDIAGWRLERMPELPDTAFFELPPDWVCEVLSPSTERYDRGAKRDIYAAAGVRHLWLLDPVCEQLETFELQNGRWLLLATYDAATTGRDGALIKVTAPPFDALPIDLQRLWA